MENSPSVSRGIDSREWNAAIIDIEPRLVLEHERTNDTRGHRLAESDNRIMGDDGATRETQAKGECGYVGDCQEQTAGEGLEVERHDGC